MRCTVEWKVKFKTSGWKFLVIWYKTPRTLPILENKSCFVKGSETWMHFLKWSWQIVVRPRVCGFISWGSPSTTLLLHHCAWVSGGLKTQETMDLGNITTFAYMQFYFKARRFFCLCLLSKISLTHFAGTTVVSKYFKPVKYSRFITERT